MAAVEILLNSPFIAELIEDGRLSEIKDAMAQSAPDGMQTFAQALYALYKADKITADEALRNADSRNNLRLRMRLEQGGDAAQAPDLELSDEFERTALDLRRRR